MIYNRIFINYFLWHNFYNTFTLLWQFPRGLMIWFHWKVEVPMIHSSSVFPRRLRISNTVIRHRYLNRRIIEVSASASPDERGAQVNSTASKEQKNFPLYQKSLKKDFFKRSESKSECPENLKRMHYFKFKDGLRPEARNADLKFS